MTSASGMSRQKFDEATAAAAEATEVLGQLRAALDLPADCPVLDLFCAAQDYRESAARAAGHSSADSDRPLVKALRTTLQVDDSADIDDLLAVADDYREAATRLPAVQATLDQVLPKALEFGREAVALGEQARQHSEEAEQLRIEVSALRAEQAAGQRDQVIVAALREGRITGAERGGLEALWQTNPDAVHSLVKARPKNSAVPVDAIGHDDDVDGDSPDDAYADKSGRVFGL